MIYAVGGVYLGDNKGRTTHSNRVLGKKEIKENMNSNTGDMFDNKHIANFSDDPVGVLGWKGTGVLLIIIIVGFTVFQLLK